MVVFCFVQFTIFEIAKLTVILFTLLFQVFLQIRFFFFVSIGFNLMGLSTVRWSRFLYAFPCIVSSWCWHMF